MARTPTAFTEKELKMISGFASVGMSRQAIANALELTRKTTYSNQDLNDAIEKGKLSMHQLVITSYYKIIKKGNFPAIRHYMATQLKIIEPVVAIKADDGERPRLLVEEAASDEPNA
jgi:hypothetical protein